MNIYIDESGNTGPDYMNKDQPFFVISAHWMNESDITLLKEKVFLEHKGDEIKFKNLTRRKDQRKIYGIIQFLESRKNLFCSYIVHKKSVLIEKFVLDCIEPVAWRDGIDLFDKGCVIAYANMLNILLPAEMGSRWYNEFLSKYNIFIRTKKKESLHELWLHCSATTKDCKDMLIPFIAYPLEALSEINIDNYKPDIYQALIIGLLVHLRNYFDIDTYNIIYDQLNSVNKHELKGILLYLEKFKKEVIVSSICKIKPGVTIKDVNDGDSKSIISLQLADLIAGITNYSFSPKYIDNDISLAYRQILDDRNLIHKICSSAVTPEELGTTNTAGLMDQIMSTFKTY